MNIKFRLIVMNFLQFAVWGAYLTCMGNYLGSAGMGTHIAWFYAIQGFVSIFMPTLMGIVADRYLQPQRVLALCHALAGIFMLSCWYIGVETGVGNEIANPSLFIALYTMSVAFYMPTIALSNTVAFTILKQNNLDTVKDFPPIRVMGTIGFIATMWFVNCATLENGQFGFTLAQSAYKFQYTYMQFFVSGLLSIILSIYALTMPKCPLQEKKEHQSLAQSFGLDAFKLFKTKKMALFFIFSALLGMCLQVTNGYAGPFITSFQGMGGAEAESFAANNATLLTSLSQISEALCILLIPFFLRRYGIKIVMLMSMLAWVFRFGFFGLGGPMMPGVLLFVLSCIVYGVAFDFFNVSGGIFVDQECEPDVKASAQGLFMMMTNGIGATVGTLSAGAIVNHYCQWTDGFLMGDWKTCWFIFAAFALVVSVSFWLVFPYKKEQK